MRQFIQDGTPDEARAEALALLTTLTERQLEARWNSGPTTGAVLRAVTANPDRIRCATGYVSADEDHPATSTVYVRPPRPLRISRGPSQFDGSWEDDELENYVHPDWCECAELRRYIREDLGLDQECGPDEIIPDKPWWPGAQVEGDVGQTQWLRLWWD